MKYASLIAGLVLVAPAAMAANANQPYSNVDHRVDAGNNTGDAQVEQLNQQQLGYPGSAPRVANGYAPFPTTRQLANGYVPQQQPVSRSAGGYAPYSAPGYAAPAPVGYPAPVYAPPTYAYYPAPAYVAVPPPVYYPRPFYSPY